MQAYVPTRNLNKTALAEAVAASTEMTQAEATEAVHAVLDVIAKTLAGGYSVSVTNFGSLHPVWVPEHRRGTTRKGEVVLVPERVRVRWITSDKLRAMVNGEAEPTITKAPRVER